MKKTDSIPSRHGLQQWYRPFAKKNKDDFNGVKSIKVECISETGRIDNSIQGKDAKAGGGINASQ